MLYVMIVKFECDAEKKKTTSIVGEELSYK